MADAITSITAKDAYKRLSAAGYPRPFIQKQLPDWWDNSLLKTSSGVFQFASILKQRLGLHLSFSEDGSLLIQPEQVTVRFKRRRDTREDQLSISASLGRALAQMAIHCIKQPFLPLPQNPLELRNQVLQLSKSNCVDFESTLSLCWQHGIPVLFLDDLPRQSRRMAGMTAIVNGRPIIVLGFKSSQKARQLFVLCHEIGHIQCGHITGDGVLVDGDISDVTETIESDKTLGQDNEEKQADSFALNLIRGDAKALIESLGWHTTPASLAMSAFSLGNELSIDPGHLILSYAKETNNWPLASSALAFDPDATGAFEIMRNTFLLNTEPSSLSDENRDYLLTAQGFSE